MKALNWPDKSVAELLEMIEYNERVIREHRSKVFNSGRQIERSRNLISNLTESITWAKGDIAIHEANRAPCADHEGTP